jgi:hypothetical protein
MQGDIGAHELARMSPPGQRAENCYEARGSYGNFLPDPRDWCFPRGFQCTGKF